MVGSFKEYLDEVHYSDYFGKNFEVFRKKYLKILKEPDSQDLYVNFTNYSGDTLDKSFSQDPTHKDPVGVYGYPLKYVVNNPSDLWYGANSRYMRILKNKRPNKTLWLQHITEGDAKRYIGKIYNTDFGTVDIIYKTTSKYMKKNVNNSVTPGSIFFWNIQHDMLSEPETKDKWGDKKITYKFIPQKEQSQRIMKLGFLALKDSASTNKKAIINDREPEQILFLRRDVFDILESFDMNLKSDAVRTISEPNTIERKLVAAIAEKMDDKLKEGPERASLNGWSYYWTQKGRRIEIDFSWSNEYFDYMSNSRRMGEKKHKEMKKYDMKQPTIKIRSEIGTFKLSEAPSTKFSEIVQDFVDRWSTLKQNPESASAQDKFEKETKAEFLGKKDKEHKFYIIQRMLKEFDKERYDHTQATALKYEKEADPNTTWTPPKVKNVRDFALLLIGNSPQLKDEIIKYFNDEILKREPDLKPITPEDELKESIESDLPLVEVIEKGILFKTGTPVTFPFLRHLQKAPNFGSRFQQDIEPAGVYMIHDTDPNPELNEIEYHKGQMHFDNPLVIELNTLPSGRIYNEHSWKALLFKKYNKKGKSLSKVLLDEGYDGIVTVDIKDKVTSEIVKL